MDNGAEFAMVRLPGSFNGWGLPSISRRKRPCSLSHVPNTGLAGELAFLSIACYPLLGKSLNDVSFKEIDQYWQVGLTYFWAHTFDKLVLPHFIKVTGLTEADFRKARDAAMEEWTERCCHNWHIDISYEPFAKGYEDMIKQLTYSAI